MSRVGVQLRSPNRELFKLFGPMIDQSSCFLMRHACSELNEKVRDFTSQKQDKNADCKDQYFDIIFNAGNRDARLSDVGVEEALKQRELVRALGIRKIMVSPMRRALETAILVVTGLHMDIEIVLVPILREQVTFKNTVCSSLAEIKSYVSQLEARLVPGAVDGIILPDVPKLAD